MICNLFKFNLLFLYYKFTFIVNIEILFLAKAPNLLRSKAIILKFI